MEEKIKQLEKQNQLLKLSLERRKRGKNEKCSNEKRKKCGIKGKVCNPKTGRCKKPEEPKKKITIKKTKIYKPTSPSYSPTSHVKKTKIYKPTSPSYSPTSPVKKTKILTIPPNTKIPTRSKVLSKVMKSYSPQANKNLGSLKSVNVEDLNNKLETLYGCEDKNEVGLKEGCFSHKSKNARKMMLELLNLKNTTITPSNVMGPRQSLSNCWLNSFFMCYFISDKGRKFFRKFRKIMITGKETDGKKIDKKYKKGLWLLNKMIQSSLYAENTERTSSFIRHADTNDVLRLLRKGSEGDKLPKTRQPANPMSFYNDLFTILGLRDGVKIFNLWHKTDYYEIFPKYNPNKIIKQSMKSIKDAEVIIISRRDDPSENDIDSKKEPPNKSFTYYGKKYVLDSAVLRDTEKKHFTSYVTIGGNEFAFEGGAFRKLRDFNWKQKLTSGKNTTWNFGSPQNTINPSKKKEGYILDQKFNFNRGYQLLFYYKEK